MRFDLQEGKRVEWIQEHLVPVLRGEVVVERRLEPDLEVLSSQIEGDTKGWEGVRLDSKTPGH